MVYGNLIFNQDTKKYGTFIKWANKEKTQAFINYTNSTNLNYKGELTEASKLKKI